MARWKHGMISKQPEQIEHRQLILPAPTESRIREDTESTHRPCTTERLVHCTVIAERSFHTIANGET